MRNYSSSFRGKGSEFFGVVVINWLLTVITLGLYYPWAKERTLKYLYANTYLENDRFQFSGTGKEMFVGFIKVFGMFLFLYLAFLFAAQSQNAALSVIILLLFYAFILGIIPFAINVEVIKTIVKSTSNTSINGITFIESNFFSFIFTL